MERKSTLVPYLQCNVYTVGKSGSRLFVYVPDKYNGVKDSSALQIMIKKISDDNHKCEFIDMPVGL